MAYQIKVRAFERIEHCSLSLHGLTELFTGFKSVTSYRTQANPH